MTKRIAFILFLNLFSFLAFAEYRVYQYYVRSKVQNLNPAQSTLVTSTLDPKSYVSYHGGRDSIEVNLLRTWMCYGDTSKTPICTISDGSEFTVSQNK